LTAALSSSSITAITACGLIFLAAVAGLYYCLKSRRKRRAAEAALQQKLEARLAARAAAAQPPEPPEARRARGALAELLGRSVTVSGCEQHSELNGCTGVVEAFDGTAFDVRMDGACLDAQGEWRLVRLNRTFVQPTVGSLVGSHVRLRRLEGGLRALEGSDGVAQGWDGCQYTVLLRGEAGRSVTVPLRCVAAAAGEWIARRVALTGLSEDVRLNGLTGLVVDGGPGARYRVVLEQPLSRMEVGGRAVEAVSELIVHAENLRRIEEEV